MAILGQFPMTRFLQPSNGQTLNFPIVVVGGSTAAYAVTLGALQARAQVCWVLPNRVLGGQFTAQALPASDDSPLMSEKLDPNQLDNGEVFCISIAQRAFRERQRQLQKVAGQVVKDPGGSWVSNLSTTPITAAIALNEALEGYLNLGKLTLIVDSEPVQVLSQQSPGALRQVTGVVFQNLQNGSKFTVQGKIIVEATDLGDLLELGNIESRVGQEARSETLEAILPNVARPMCQQAFTYCAVVEYSANSSNAGIGAPLGFGIAAWLNPQEFTEKFWVGQEARDFFADFGIFRYRRLQKTVDDQQVRRGDVTVLNWGRSPIDAIGTVGNGNDYIFGALTGVSRIERQQHLKQARDRTQAYLHFFQTNVDQALVGRGDLCWTADGIALEPYIREARRGVAMTTIRHEHVGSKFFQNSARGYSFEDSVGIGHYFYLDFHPNNADGHVNLDDSGCLPFTLPLKALIPLQTDGLLLSAKSIGTTHITNAAYRMHPMEWAIGEAGGHLAAFALDENVSLREVADSVRLTRKFQSRLTSFGIPIFWFDDISHKDPDFTEIQVLAAAGIVRTESIGNLNFKPENSVNRAVVAVALSGTLGLPLLNPAIATFIDVPPSNFAFQSIETLFASGIVSGVGNQRFAPGANITRKEFSTLIQKVASNANIVLNNVPNDGQNLVRRELSRVLHRLLKEQLGF